MIGFKSQSKKQHEMNCSEHINKTLEKALENLLWEEVFF